MFDYFQYQFDSRRWLYATDCVSALYAVQLTPNPADPPTVDNDNNKIRNEPQQNKN